MLQAQWVHLDADLARSPTGELRLQDAGNAGELILEVLAEPLEPRLVHRTRQRDDHDREIGHRDLTDLRVFGLLG